MAKNHRKFGGGYIKWHTNTNTTDGYYPPEFVETWQKIIANSGGGYIKWHTNTNTTDGYYPPEFDLSDSEYDITKKLVPYGITVNMDKSGKYDLIRTPIADFYDDDDFGIIDLGDGIKIAICLNFHFKRYKNPLMDIEIEFNGPEGHIGDFEGGKFNMNRNTSPGWFSTIHFAIYDDIIYDGNKKGIITEKVEVGKSDIPVYKVHNLEDDKVYYVKADNMIHNTEIDRVDEEGEIDICLVDDFV